MKLLQKHFDIALESPNGIKKLRELILTLAMQGKLVKQDPSDQPASELLNEIQVEKERLSKEGKIKKQKELKPIKPEEIPYEVPEGWVWTRLGNAGQFERGISKHRPRNDSKLFSNGIYPLVQTGDVSQSKHTKNVISTSGSYYNIFGLAQSRLWEKGTLCITIAANIAETGFLGFDACFPDSVVAYLSIGGVSSLFIKYFIDIAKSDLEHYAPSTAQKNINLGIINGLVFPLPPLAEQKRIVYKIGELMTLCDKLEEQHKASNDKRQAVHNSAINHLLTSADKKIFDESRQFITRHFDPLYSVKENVAELKKAILTLAMQGKLVKQDPNDQSASDLLKELQSENESLIIEGKIKKQIELPQIKPEEVLYEVPSGWVPVRSGHLFSLRKGKVPKDLSDTIGAIPYLDIEALDRDNVRRYTNDLKTPQSTDKDILVVCDGSRSGLILNGRNGAIGSTLSIIDASKKIQPFIRIIFEEGFERFNTTMKGAAIPHLDINKLINEIVCLPPLAEQKRIVAKIDELMALCNKLENQIDQATAKQTALFDAVLAEV